jgi:hypothetical protein
LKFSPNSHEQMAQLVRRPAVDTGVVMVEWFNASGGRISKSSNYKKL